MEHQCSSHQCYSREHREMAFQEKSHKLHCSPSDRLDTVIKGFPFFLVLATVLIFQSSQEIRSTVPTATFDFFFPSLTLVLFQHLSPIFVHTHTHRDNEITITNSHDCLTSKLSEITLSAKSSTASHFFLFLLVKKAQHAHCTRDLTVYDSCSVK